LGSLKQLIYDYGNFLTSYGIIFHLYSTDFPALQIIAKFANDCSEKLSYGKNFLSYDL